MAFTHVHLVIQDEDGNIVDNASVTVREEIPGAPLASVYADGNGSSPLGNPYTATDGANAGFYVAAGMYRIDALGAGGFTRTWRDVPVFPRDLTDSEGFADSDEAIEGTNETKFMSPARTKDAIQGGEFFTQDGTGAVPRTLIDKLKDLPVSSEDFDAVGDGSADDTAELLAAVTKLGSAGGYAALRHGGKYLLSNITLPDQTGISGGLDNPEQQEVGESHYQLGSQLKLASGQTITFGRGSGIRGALIIRAGLTQPPANNSDCTTLLGQFAGTACSLPETGGRLRDCMLAGHSTAITASLASDEGRILVSDVHIDATNGISISGARDICRISNVHCWPFLTAHVSGVTAANLQRSGTAFYLGSNNDWSSLNGCFSYGYTRGFVFDGASAVTANDCKTDYTNPNTNNVCGFEIKGASEYIRLNNPIAIGQKTGVLINSTATNPVAQVNDGTFACTDYCIDVQDGDADINGGTFQSATTAINIGANAGDVRIIAPYIKDCTNGIVFDASWTGKAVIVAPQFSGVTTKLTIPAAVLSQVTIVAATNDIAPIYNQLQNLRVRDSNAQIMFDATGSSTNEKLSDVVATGATLQFRVATDAGVFTTAFQVNRSGGSPTSVGYAVKIIPSTNDGAALGDTSNKWSDAYFASGAVLNFNNGDVTLTHASDELALAGGHLRTSSAAYDSTFNPNVQVTNLELIGSSPSFAFKDTGGGSDAKYADVFLNTTDLSARFLNDAFNAANSIFQSTRSGYTVSQTSFFAGSSVEQLRLATGNHAYWPNIGTTASAANAFLNSGSSPANELLRSTSSLAYKRDVEPIDGWRADNVLKLDSKWYRSKAAADNPDHSWYGLIAEEVAEVDPRLVHWGYQEKHFEDVDIAETILVDVEDGMDDVVHDIIVQDGFNDEGHPVFVKRPVVVKKKRYKREERIFYRKERRLKDDAEKVPDGVMYDRLTVLLLDVVKRLRSELSIERDQRLSMQRDLQELRQKVKG